MIKKYDIPFLLSIMLCVFLTSCGIPEPPGEKEISQTLPDEIKTLIVENPFDQTNADLYEMETKTTIVKRQTNEKEDLAYCEVQLKCEYYQIVKYLELNFNYYDKGGWILDGYSEYQDPEWKLLKCPFNVGEVIYPVYELFPQVEFKRTEEWLDDGAVDFYFTVEDPRENGTYSGTASVELFFDFITARWDYYVNTNQVKFIWDIEGEWQYSKNTPIPPWGTLVEEISLKIEHFDQEAGTMEGSWYMKCHDPVLSSHSETLMHLDNPERVAISVTDKSLIELWENPGKMVMHSYVEFSPDKVKACFATKFGEVYLERASNKDKTLSNQGDGIDASDRTEIMEMLIQYFDSVKSGENISLGELSARHPHILGDDFGETLQCALSEGIIKDFQYEVVMENQYFCDQEAARKTWEEKVEDEFHENIPIPESYAEIQLKIHLETTDKMTSQEAEYFQDPSYTPILLAKYDGKWSFLYVDDLFSEMEDPFFS